MEFNSLNNNKTIQGTNPLLRKEKEDRLNKMSNDEKIDMFAPNAAKLLSKKAEFEVPENGKFSTVSISFDIPGTQNVAYYYVEFDELEPKEQRRFTIAAARDGSDRLTNANIFKGTKKELLEFLNDPNNAQLFRDSLREASRRTDDYYSSF